MAVLSGGDRTICSIVMPMSAERLGTMIILIRVTMAMCPGMPMED